VPAALTFSRAQVAFTAALRTSIARFGLAKTIAPGMGPVLFALARGNRSLSELADAAGVRRSTMTGIANRMVKQGLIRIYRNPVDRRGVVVSLTTKGRRTIPRLRKIERALDARFRRALGPHVGALTDYLEKVIAELVERDTN